MRDIMTSWIPPVVAATICDALCDISSDHVILTHDEHEHDSDDEDEEALSSEEKYQARRNKLTSEQDLLCSCVAMLVISMWLRVHHGFALWAPELGLPYWWTLFAGVIYAIGMMSIMKAWEHVPSTVVTPMLQMSGPAVEVMEALLGHNASAHWMLAPLANSSLTLMDAAAFVFIVTGGLLPSTSECGSLFSFSQWRQPVRTSRDKRRAEIRGA